MSGDFILKTSSSAEVLEYIQGLDFKGFLAHRMAYDAVVRNLEIIGEAAKNIPDEIALATPTWNGGRL